jgi:hypothetical protein
VEVVPNVELVCFVGGCGVGFVGSGIRASSRCRWGYSCRCTNGGDVFAVPSPPLQPGIGVVRLLTGVD